MDTVAPDERKRPPTLRQIGALASLVAIAACTQPWTEIAFTRLWGEGHGIVGLKTHGGLVVVVASVLALLLPALGGGDQQGRKAVETGALVTALVALFAAGYEIVAGPAPLDGVTTGHTAWFYATLVATAVAGTCALLRWSRSS